MEIIPKLETAPLSFLDMDKLMFAHKQYWRSVGEAFRLPSITAMLSGGETPPLQGLCVSANTPLNINLSTRFYY